MTRKYSMTSTTATRDMAKFTSSNTAFSTGNIIFSTRTFLMSGAASRMEYIAAVVEFCIRLNRMVPRMRYRGKWSMLSHLRNMLKTADRTTIMSNGLSTDQRMPSTLRRYFSLKSFVTSDWRMNQLFCHTLAFAAFVVIGLLAVIRLSRLTNYSILVYGGRTKSSEITVKSALMSCRKDAGLRGPT